MTSDGFHPQQKLSVMRANGTFAAKEPAKNAPMEPATQDRFFVPLATTAYGGVSLYYLDGRIVRLQPAA